MYLLSFIILFFVWLKKAPMKNIVLFASGSGTNAENIIRYFAESKVAKVAALFSNNPAAMVLERAKNLQVDSVVFSKEELITGRVLKHLNKMHPDLIVLAGFLLQFPEDIIEKYLHKIINIHPALLPKYGGKGMYGAHVHKAVLENKEKETGISIHYVNSHYDEGEIIFQKNISIENCTTYEEIAEKIHQLEQDFFPKIIEQILTEQQ